MKASGSHYIPVFILKNFACSDAWRLVPPERQDKVREVDQCAIEKKSRNIPLCLYSKTQLKKVRGIAKLTCVEKAAYDLNIAEEDVYSRGLAAVALSNNLGAKSGKLLSKEDIIAMAPLAPANNFIEEMLSLSLEGEVAHVMWKIIEQKAIDGPDISVLKRFIAVSMVRNPAWKNDYYKGFARDAVLKANQDIYFHHAKIIAENPETEMILLNMSQLLLKILYPSSLERYIKETLTAFEDPLIEITAWFRQDPPYFILGDNPSRPFSCDKIGKLFRYTQPGIVDGLTIIAHPLSPQVFLALRRAGRQPAKPICYREADEGLVRGLNTAMAELASENVIFSTLNDDVFLPEFDIRRCRPWKEPFHYRQKQRRKF